MPVEPKVSMAYSSPSSIFVASPPCARGDRPGLSARRSRAGPAGADVAEAHGDARLLDARVGRLARSLRQQVELRVEVDRPCGVDDPPVDVRPKVNLAHVAVLQHRLVARVGRPVRGHVVERAAGREGNAGLEAVLLDAPPVQPLQLLAHVGHEHARPDHVLHVLAHLPVALGGGPHLLVRRPLQPLQVAHLCGRRAVPAQSARG